MEEENQDKTPAGRAEESDVNSVTPPETNIKVEELQKSENETKCDAVNEPDEDQQSENNNDTGGGSEIKSGSSASDEKVLPELTLVLIGDTNSIEVGSKNILLDHDEQANVEQYSAKLYDLCGRLISVINMLGLKNTDSFPLNEEIHAFLLLLPNGLHISHYSSGVQWLEEAFGKGSLAYLMTVVTHESDENCESALTELKPNSKFAGIRYHTCTRSMKDEKEIIALLDKIDVMVSENDPHCYSGLMCDENKQKEHLEHKSHEEGKIDSSVFQQNPTGDELEERAATTEVKRDPANGAKHSDNNNDSTREEGDTENKSVKPSVTSDQEEAGEGKEIYNESSSNTSGRSIEERTAEKDTSQPSETDPTATTETDELEERAATTGVKCDPANGAKHSDNSDDSTREGGDTEDKSVEPSVTSDQEEADEGKEINSESSSNTNERSIEERTAENDTSHTSQTDSTATKQREELEEERAPKTNVKCDPVDKPADVEHCKKNDNNTPVAGESEIKSVPSATEENGTTDMNLCGNDEKQSEKISEDTNMKKQYQAQTETLLSRLHLQDKHQQKFSPADFLQIGPPVKQDQETCEKDLAHTFLHRLMMLDYRARYIPVKQDSADFSHLNPVETDDNDLDVLYGTSVDSDQSKQSHVHPMDIQMAVFHCSDSFFRQNMITKLSQCQYAVPLLVPDLDTMDIECPLWTFRKIRKTWKTTKTEDNSNTVTMKSMPICNAKTPMVSFFRLGSLSQSKSQLMNTLIKDRYDTFFHRNCPGSTKSRYLMDGMAEIAWYCPAGKPNDAFTDCIAFCNLHGDALLNEKQRDILTEKSSVNVVLVPTLEKGDKSSTVISALYKSAKPLIILIADNDSGAVQMKEGKYKIGLKDKSQSDVSEEMKGIIRNILSGPHASFQLETMAEVSRIRVDEGGSLCRKGKSAAEEIVKLLKGMDGLKIKETFLQCQGQLWSKWCRTNEELYHLTGDIERDKSEKEQELKRIRQDQCEASCSELMRLFIDSLSSLKSTDREYFLKWTQILMDALCTDDLSSILQSYDKKWSEVLALKKKHDKSDQLKMKRNELEQISTKLQSVTFGLEHMFREMGQIYEAHKSLKKQPTSRQTDWSKYPELAAELMISGHPMELMDGDAGHVPLTWISCLLEEVIKKLGNKRVFVLSVLGVQSSGKSTMLNAMFGLQFAVSAGRCTKGAFMQLVRVSEETKKDFQFDYVLVVDTEGLRALELEGNATLHRDNELATFVVGLGNMTLINIFGENPADMQDVLQIVVQAFMRMKQVKRSASCVFVHQNVSDIAAAEMNMDGKRRLQDKLDQMAQLAAKEEGCDAECFSDVITFDVQKDVKYFATLWEGSPPMAPPNPGYSESIQELKTFILSKASQSEGITLEHFKIKINDLWNALLNENFVFSFKNTYEIAVYRKLEVQYGNWTWTLRKNMLTIEDQLYTRIENRNLDKIELSYLYTEMSKTDEEIQNAMTTYFDDDNDKQMLVQWRGTFKCKIKEFHDEQVRGVQRKLEEVIQQKKACKKLDDNSEEFENNLLQKSKDLAHQLKDKTNDQKELENQFNSVWSRWVTELTAGTTPIKDINYKEDLSKILQDLGFEWTLINKSKMRGSYKNMSEIEDYSHYVTSRKLWNKLTSYLTGSAQDEQQRIRFLIENIEQQSLDSIKKKPVATQGYSQAYLQEVANEVKKQVTEFESKKKYTLKKKFTVNLVLYVFDRAESWLTESHKKFKMNNDALVYLESKKEQYYNIFKSVCKGSSSAVVFGELICEKLKSSTVEAVCNNTAIGIADEMRCSFPAFSGNRLDLEKHVLKSLAEKEDFDDFMTYIRNPKKQVEKFIEEEVENYISSKQGDKAKNILKKNVEDINTFVSQALFEATEKIKSEKIEREKIETEENKTEENQTEGGDIDKWVKEFSSLLHGKLIFTISSQNFSDINNFNFLKEEIEKGLKSIMEEMSSLSLNKMKEFRNRPDQILIKQLCDCCWVTCPFCAAVCTNTLNNHDGDHSVPFHRPQAVNGYHYSDTVELSVDFCTTDVVSDHTFYPSGSDKSVPFKVYRTAGPKYANWRITPDESTVKYWTWFVCRFKEELEDYYDLKFQGRGEIPKEWNEHTIDDAIESLDKMFK